MILKFKKARSSGSINDYGLIISELKIGGSYPLKKSMLMHVIDLSSKKPPNHVKHQWIAQLIQRNSVDRPTQNAAETLTKPILRIRRWWVKLCQTWVSRHLDENCSMFFFARAEKNGLTWHFCAKWRPKFLWHDLAPRPWYQTPQGPGK